MKISAVNQYKNINNVNSFKRGNLVPATPDVKFEEQDEFISQKTSFLGNCGDFLGRIGNYIKFAFEIIFDKDTITYQSSKRKKEEVLAKEGISAEAIDVITGLKKEQFNQIMDLITLGLDDDCITQAAEFGEREYNNAQTLLSKSITEKPVIKLSQLSDEDFQECINLFDDGVSAENCEIYFNLSKNGQSKSKEYLEQGYTPQEATLLPILTQEELNAFMKLKEKGISSDSAFEIVSKYPKKIIKRYLRTNNSSEIDTSLGSYYTKSPEQKERIQKLKRMGIETEYAIKFSKTKERYEEALKLIKEGTIDKILYDILLIEKGETKNPKYHEYREKGYGKNSSFALSILDSDEEDVVNEFVKKDPSIIEYFKNNYDVIPVKLQLQDTNELIFSKEIYKNGSKIVFTDIHNSKGEKQKFKSVIYQDGRTESRTLNGNTDFILRRAKSGTIEELTQYIKGQDNAVENVIHAKASTTLKGAFDINSYNIDDFLSDTNPENIKRNVRSSGIIYTPMSKVIKQKDGTLIYKERFAYDGYYTDRIYTQKENKKGEPIYKKYNYKIFDNTGKEYINLQNSWRKNDNGSVTNIINGNEYLINYDDKNKSIEITHQNNKKNINLKNIIARYPADLLWDTAKKLDVDSLLYIDKYIRNWRWCSDEDSIISAKGEDGKYILETGNIIPIIYHEIGHLKEHEVVNTAEFEKLKETYTKEFDKFSKVVPYEEQKIIQYLSPRAEFYEAIGLDELVAESNMIFKTYEIKVTP